MKNSSLDVEARFQAAIQSYWDTRGLQTQKQIQSGKLDAGLRGAVTGGSQMGALELLVLEILIEAGLSDLTIRTRLGLELPGYFRPEKKWDLLVISEKRLVCAIEFKSQVGPSFGNNFNNRTEEAIGNAVDIWTAYREGLLGDGPRPFLGFFFLLEDCPKVHKPVKLTQPHFSADPEFVGSSYAKRYEILGRRLILEHHYEGVCLTLTTNSVSTQVSHPAPDLSFGRFVQELRGVAQRFV